MRNAAPAVNETGRLLEELRRIEQVVRALGANDVSNVNNVNMPVDDTVPHNDDATPPVSAVGSAVSARVLILWRPASR